MLLTLAILGIMSTGLVSAYMGGYNNNRGTYYDEDSILVDGSYDDLVEYRKNVGYNEMPWIQNEEDFKYAQQRMNTMMQRQTGYNGYNRMPMMNQMQMGYGMGYGGCGMGCGCW